MNLTATTVEKQSSSQYRYRVYYRPGLYMTDAQKQSFMKELYDTATTCFARVPNYQVMSRRLDELNDKVIAVAWRHDGRIAGFCSTVLLPVEGVGEVIHLGLTCIRPEDRSNGLTHVLTSKAVKSYLLRHKPILGKVWISNCAAVLSSLANVALHFEKVYPSPDPKARPTEVHRKISEAVDRYFRDKIYIHDKAVFDREHFVFRGSVKDTVFQKSGDDAQYYHRNSDYNEYYRAIMNFNEGDEVLQIGYASTFAAIKHMYTKSVQKFITQLPFPQLPMAAMQQKEKPQNRPRI